MKLVYSRNEAVDLNKGQDEFNEFSRLDHLHRSIERHLTKITELERQIADEEKKLLECYTAKKLVMGKIDGDLER